MKTTKLVEWSLFAIGQIPAGALIEVAPIEGSPHAVTVNGERVADFSNGETALAVGRALALANPESSLLLPFPNDFRDLSPGEAGNFRELVETLRKPRLGEWMKPGTQGLQSDLYQWRRASRDSAFRMLLAGFSGVAESVLEARKVSFFRVPGSGNIGLMGEQNAGDGVSTCIAWREHMEGGIFEHAEALASLPAAQAWFQSLRGEIGLAK